MADDTTAALQALIKQVSNLTTAVTDQKKQMADQQKKLDGLHDFNARILDEKKDLQRKLEATPKTHTAEAIADMAKMGYEPGADGNWYKAGTQPAHTLTREEARNPATYRAAKKAAAKAGAKLEIVDPDKPEDAHRRGRGDVATTNTTVIKDEDARRVYVRRDVLGSSSFRAQYQKLRDDGFTPESWDQPDDLPQHMQTKLALMEKSNDA